MNTMIDEITAAIITSSSIIGSESPKKNNVMLNIKINFSIINRST